MASRLFGNKPLFEPMLDHWTVYLKRILVVFELIWFSIKKIDFEKSSLNCRSFCLGFSMVIWHFRWDLITRQGIGLSQWETTLHCMSSLIGWYHTQNDPCMWTLYKQLDNWFRVTYGWCHPTNGKKTQVSFLLAIGFSYICFVHNKNAFHFTCRLMGFLPDT